MVEPETFAFLEDLAKNNRKAWMDDHRAEFDDARRNFTGMAMTLHSYADRFDHEVADAKSKPKQSYSKLTQDPRHRVGKGLYRAEVDVFANAGRADEDFGYYVHIEPGNCYAGVGIFQPSKDALERTRARLVDDLEGFEQMLADPDFKAAFPDGVITRKDLGVVPKGFDDDDPAAAYLTMVGFECRQNLTDALMLDDDVMDRLIEIFRAASPLVRYFD